MITDAKSAFAFDVLLLATFAGMAVLATQFTELARIFPLTVSVIGVILCFAHVATQAWRLRASPAHEPSTSGTAAVAATVGDSADDGSTESSFGRVVYFFGWIAGFLILIRIVGLLIAAAVFVTTFLWIEGKMRWYQIAIVAVAALLGLALLSSGVGIVWPQGLLDRL